MFLSLCQCLAPHGPLGSINRPRKTLYFRGATSRKRLNVSESNIIEGIDEMPGAGNSAIQAVRLDILGTKLGRFGPWLKLQNVKRFRLLC